MSWSMTKRRIAVTTTTTGLVVAALLGSSLGTIARETAAPKKTAHAISSVVSYIPGSPLVVTIEHPFYDATAQVQYAEIDDSNGGLIGYLLPYPTNATKRGQAVKANRLTVAFNTNTFYCLPPNTTPPPPSIPIPSVGSGSILLIHTNIDTDTPPAIPIQLDTVFLAL